jgi:N-acetylglutamate synthase-like GNAT family acetyltransferase
VAIHADLLVGCAAVRLTSTGGYLYGLAVRRENQRLGIGSALTLARVHRIREHGGRLAAVLAMFWNVRFFTRFGFRLTPKKELAASIQRLADFRDPLYRRSAALVLSLADHRGTR